MEYQVIVLPTAEKDLDLLSPTIRERVVRRLRWLSQNATEVIHHALKGMPEDLVGLCKLRVGDYRILYWKKDSKQEIQVFRVRHRSEVYKKLDL